MRNVLVVSLKFNPGHFSHLIANYRLLTDAGLDPILYIHPQFSAMDSRGEYRKMTKADELQWGREVNGAVFWFPSARNIIEVLRLKFRCNASTRIIYIYHEPFESIFRYVRSGSGLPKVAKVCVAHFINLFMVLFSSHVVLPSLKAYRIYDRKYRWLNRNYSTIPLMFDDENRVPDERREKKSCISYIGTVAADHAFERFLRFVDAAITGGWLNGYNFLIATRSKIALPEAAVIERLERSGRLEVTQGRPMSNEEINGFFSKSLVVWNAYNRSMQSGVLPKAYMFGAAVIVTRAGEIEFVEDYVTGRIVDSNEDVVEIKNAIEEIATRSHEYEKACRAKFESTFYYKASAKKFVPLIT